MTAESHREGAPERLDVPFELKSLETRRRDDGAEVGVFDGLASTFGNKDMAGDLIEPGAFAASLAGPGAIKMLWQHDARAPIGVWEKVAETAAGLEVRGRLVLEVQQAREALALLRAGAVDALSIGFSVPPGGAVLERAKGLRRLRSIELWEISIVTFPANPRARIGRVKARPGEGLPSPRDFERLIRREAGLSRTEARTVTRAGYRALAARRDARTGGAGEADGSLAELAARIKRVAALVAEESSDSAAR